MSDISTIKIKKNNKNSIMELLRFLFSLWVLYFHGYVPYRNELFSDGKLSVEFFFVLSGFFLVRSMKKYESLPFLKGLSTFLFHRFKSLSTVFIIGEIFVLIYSFVFDFSYNFMFGFLWYIRDLFVAMALFFTVKKVIKRDSLFYVFISLLSLFSIFISGKLPGCAEWPGGAFRAFASMPIGMLVAAIPRFTDKSEEGKNKNILIGAAVAGFIATGILCLYIIAAPEKSIYMVYILVIFGYPALLYFANQIPLSVGFLNWLGTLSFPIYSFQCILRVINELGVTDETHLFIIIVALVLLYSFVSESTKRNKFLKTNK